MEPFIILNEQGADHMAEFQYSFGSQGKLLKDIHTICKYHFSEKSIDSQPHRHEHWEIGYALSGEGFFHMDAETYEIAAGDLALVAPGTLHSEKFCDHSSLEMLFLMFSNKFSPSLSLDLPIKGSLMLSTQNQPMIEEILKSILVEATDQNTGFDRFISADLVRLFVSIYRLANDSTLTSSLATLAAAVNVRKVKIAFQMKAYIDESLGQHYNIGDMASMFYFSPQHLTRVFKEVTGKTPKEYETESKINKAKILLKSQHEVARIADQLGYASINHFYKAFKNETGMTPIEYRSSH
jgi:AraC-like DNA-binding protein/mannose-6-phosphate isomerase-like protein (cupin superfamily)